MLRKFVAYSQEYCIDMAIWGLVILHCLRPMMLGTNRGTISGGDYQVLGNQLQGLMRVGESL